MEYTTLFLDLDNTLLDFSKSEEWAITQTLEEFGLPSDSETARLYSEINNSYWKRFEKGEIPKNAIFEGRFKTLLSVLKREGNTKSISEFYCKCLSNTYFKVEGADEVLTYLKNKGYKLYATTNGFAFTQKNRIKNSGLSKYFDAVFISEDLNAQKPEKEYFEACIRGIPEKNKSKILIVGDSQSSDILGGINVSIDTCWFKQSSETAKYHSKYTIENLKKLTEIL